MSDPARSLAAPCADRRRGWLLLAMLGLAFGAGLAATPAIATTTAVTIDVALDDETYVVHASAQVAADQELVWGTLTDYQRLREFVP
ncbi:MAG TPA: hypothetical protein PL117_10765, partial [Accumulibacter sp.]|uniref:hypothetical protein n=1 Tax=Accumulibacter sp. TaxID=2053492 RepID=UPI002BD15E38